MNCLSNDNTFKLPYRKRFGFTLIEVGASLALLALITSTVLVVMNRCIEAAIDSRTKMEAFELARENIEKLLASTSVKDTADFGVSETNPDLNWETVVETFYEPITSRMWVQAVCSGSYIDTKGELQSVELTCWLTDITRKDINKILEQQRREDEYLRELAELDAFGDDAEGMMLHVEYLILTGDYQQAYEILEEVKLIFPESPEAGRAETIQRDIEKKMDVPSQEDFELDKIMDLQ